MALGLIQFRCSSVAPPGGAGNVVLQEIDGGVTYYGDHGFTNAVNAGYDSKSFVEFGDWPSYLLTALDYQRHSDLGCKSALFPNGNSDWSLAGATYDVWWWPLLDDTNPNLIAGFQNNGPWLVGITVTDEPGYWSGDPGGRSPVELINGTSNSSVLKTATNKTTVCVGKPLWVDFFNNVLSGSLGNTPVPGSAASYYYSDVFDPGGNRRKLNLGSFDAYWFAGSNDSSRAMGPGGTFSAIRGLGDNSYVFHPVTVAGGTVNIPTSFPTPFTFTTDPNLPIQVGAPCLIQASGGAGYMGMIGAVTSYTSLTGVCTINVVDGNTYTVIAASGFAGSIGPRQFQVAAIDGFAWLGSGSFSGPIITCTTNPARIPAGTHYAGMDAVTSLSLGSNGTAWNFFVESGVTTTLQINDVVKIASTITLGGTSGPQNNFKARFGLTIDQARKACHYGDMIDAQRGFQYSAPGFSPSRDAAPIGQFIDNTAAFQNCGATLGGTPTEYVTPFEFNAAVWATIMHGGLRIFWFDSPYGGTQQSQAGQLASAQVYFQTVQTANNYFGVPNTISTYDQMKLTHRFVQKLAPVINSKIAYNYVSVSPNGFACPWPASYVQNDGVSLPSGWDNQSPGTGTYNNFLGQIDGNNVTSFEVMAKYYNDPSSGLFVQGHYWIFAGYRGSSKDTNKTATFTIVNTGAATVTRFCMDAVISAAASGNSPGDKTRITCSDTSQMVVGDPATFQSTVGFTIAGSSPNGVTFNISAIPDATHFEVPGVFGGSSPGGSSPGVALGQVLVSHDIATTGGGVTFQDTFTRGTDIRIYRVN